MFNSIRPPLYMRLSPNRLIVRNVKTKAFISDIPEVALVRGPKLRILAVGAEAALRRAMPSVEVINPFNPPDSMTSDFSIGGQVLKAFLCRLRGKLFSSISPRLVFHPQGSAGGSFTQTEINAFREMVRCAGVSHARIWLGPTLSDEEVLSEKYPRVGQMLE